MAVSQRGRSSDRVTGVGKGGILGWLMLEEGLRVVATRGVLGSGSSGGQLPGKQGPHTGSTACGSESVGPVVPVRDPSRR